jgi:exo-beta-1,3-glucanase (GH17 family)
VQVDWIGINVFPWWENKYSGVHPCIPAIKAADFHIERIEEIQKTYPDKEVILTEFGWPNGPKDGTEVNKKTGQHCGIANNQNQKMVIKATFKKLAKQNRSGVVFEAFSENWKPSNEGNFGDYWGICQGTAPYHCIKDLTNH